MADPNIKKDWRPKDAQLSIGKPLSGPEQFELRSQQVGKAAPWAGFLPYLTQNLAVVLGANLEHGSLEHFVNFLVDLLVYGGGESRSAIFPQSSTFFS